MRVLSKRDFCKLIGAESLYTTSESMIKEYIKSDYIASISTIPEIMSITIASVYSTYLINYDMNNEPCALVHSVFLSVPFTAPGEPFFKEYVLPKNLFLSIIISDYNERIKSKGIADEFLLFSNTTNPADKHSFERSASKMDYESYYKNGDYVGNTYKVQDSCTNEQFFDMVKMFRLVAEWNDGYTYQALRSKQDLTIRIIARFPSEKELRLDYYFEFEEGALFKRGRKKIGVAQIHEIIQRSRLYQDELALISNAPDDILRQTTIEKVFSMFE